MRAWTSAAAAAALGISGAGCGGAPPPHAEHASPPVAASPEPVASAAPAVDPGWELSLPSELSGIALAPTDDGGVVVTGTLGSGRAWIARVDGAGQLSWQRTLESEAAVVPQDVAVAGGSIHVVGTARRPVQLRDEAGQVVHALEPEGAAQRAGDMHLELAADGAIVSAILLTPAATPPPARRRDARRVISLDEIVIESPFALSRLAVGESGPVVPRGGVLRVVGDGTELGPLAEDALASGVGSVWTVLAAPEQGEPRSVTITRFQVGTARTSVIELEPVERSAPPDVDAWLAGPRLLFAGRADGAAAALPFASRVRCAGADLSASGVDALVLGLDAMGSCAWAATLGGDGDDVPLSLDRAADGATALLLLTLASDTSAKRVAVFAVDEEAAPEDRGRLDRIVLGPTGAVVSRERIADDAVAVGEIAITADSLFVAWGSTRGGSTGRRLVRTAR